MVNKHFQETRAETIKSFALILKATSLNGKNDKDDPMSLFVPF